MFVITSCAALLIPRVWLTGGRVARSTAQAAQVVGEESDARKGEVPKREVLPDPKFTDQADEVRRRLTKFINTVMVSGKEAVAERIVYGALDKVGDRAKKIPSRSSRRHWAM